ncbi:hypothetical protein CAP36_10355 [Chitinophagaceae bacterium IBVUCB2]|nr:hypothetical protein CAP36_10355 [Chitinophagaceae bacterium IBVUCB2]
MKRFLILAAFCTPAFASLAQSYNNIEFIENKGQWDSRVQYKGDVSNGAFFIRESGFTVLQHNPVDFANLATFFHGQKPDGSAVTAKDNITLRSHAYHVDFLGASTSVKTIPEKVVSTYNNYFVGNDPSKWANECRLYQVITLKNIYPNIDVRYYTDNNFLKYDIIVRPGGDVSKIAMKYDGTDKLLVKNKQLIMETSVGELKESAPYTYQADINGKKEVRCRYVVKDNVVRFVVDNYNPSETLVIDPTVTFCSFAGGNADNWGFTATYGPDGSMYAGGIVFTQGSWPVSPGAFQTIFQGGAPNQGSDMGIIKLNPNGTNRVYATYLGGSGNEQPHSLIVDNQGNLVIAGRTNSGNYPVTANGTLGGTGYDIVVTKLNATGTAIIGSKKIGGSSDDGVNIVPGRTGTNSLNRNYGDDGRSEVILDGAGNVYVASSTQSNNFPGTTGFFQSSFGGGSQDGVLLKFNSNISSLLFASYLGGSANDAAYVLSLDPAGNIYVAGGTESTNFPGNKAGAKGPNNHGGIDGFISVVNNTGTAIIRTTYVGTNGADQIFGVQFDNRGFPYIMGQTTGNWEITPGTPTYGSATGKQFIVKFQPDLSAYVYSTVFGTSSLTPNISPIAFLVDRCENVYISGWGGFFGTDNVYSSAGTTGLPVTPDAFKSATDGKDFYFFVLKKDATQQLFGSFFGENNSIAQGGVDHVDGGTSRFDSQGRIYQAICGNCKLNNPPLPYPVTTGAWATVNNTPNCNLTMLKIEMNLAGVEAGVQSAIGGAPRDTAGCLPLTVDFIDTIAKAQSYEWYFNYVPGNPPDLTTTVPSASHTYTAVGTYPVMLVAIDPTTCNIRDSSFLNIRVGDLEANLAFSNIKLPPCSGFNYEFTNLSTTDITAPFKDTSFIWDFGDGSPRVVRGMLPIQHTFPGPGTYTVKLILKDSTYCNNPDSIEIELDVADNVRARFTTPANGCIPYTAVFDNTSLAGETWLWDFGDGNTSTAFEPTHTYTAVGTYNVVLIAYNPNTCNGSDTARFTIQTFDAPVPDFSFAPIPAQENTPTTFTNLSSADAIRFKWVFGDGDSLITTSRAPVSHQYNATGTFNACLTAYNAADCDSTICRPVTAVIVPLVDVPNAFTPQSGDVNSVVMVRGFGIARMQFIIWNRWGQKVFETNDRFRGWDGRVKGVIQPMDVYAYTLSVEFFDGVKTTKKGDITLIR